MPVTFIARVMCLVTLSTGVAHAADLRWADFIAPATTTAGAVVNAIALSEKAGDVQLESMAVVGDLLHVTGRLGDRHGSRWVTLGMDVAADPSGRPVDVSSARLLHIRLGAGVPQVVRIRLKGPDRRILDAGCYPVMMQRVTTEALDYAIPVEAFAPESYCGDQGATVAETLAALTHVEVTLNHPSPVSQTVRVGPIELVDAEKPVPEPSRPASRPATRREPPKKPAAAPKPASAAARSVTCERNRLGLMMCY